MKLHRIDPESPLAHDMTELDIPFILLHMTFPDNFPFSPPFLRVVEPRIEKGFVMEGGAICMELLTPRGEIECGRVGCSKFLLKNSISTNRLGIRLHHRSHSHAICRKLSERPRQDMQENKSEPRFQPKISRGRVQVTRQDSRQIRLDYTSVSRRLKFEICEKELKFETRESYLHNEKCPKVVHVESEIASLLRVVTDTL